METISIFDGLVLTVVSMFVVFIVLGAIWGLVELVAMLVARSEEQVESVEIQKNFSASNTSTNPLAPNTKHQQVAELMALVLASEDEPNKKFEIVESKRVK